jgi:hypothetical protein
MGVSINIEHHNKIYIDKDGNQIEAPTNHKRVVRQPRYHKRAESEEEETNQ